jgi:hypothetical protein
VSLCSRHAAAIVAAFVLGGCAAIESFSRYPPEAGWRSGYVKAVGKGEPFRSLAAQRCPHATGGTGEERFATIRVRHMQRSWEITVPLSSGIETKLRARVHVNVKDCGAPLIPRVD